MSTEPVVTKLVTTKPDSELANEFRRRLVEAHAPILALLDEIDAAGLEAAVSCGKGPPFGKFGIANLQIVKRL